MENVLVLAHVEDAGGLSKPSLEAVVTAAALSRDLAGSHLVIGLVGSDAQAAADSVAGCGASRFLAATGTDFTVARYATDAAAAEALTRAAGATLVLALREPRVGLAACPELPNE